MADFYQDKSVVVLGGAGFVGRHLCRSLEARGAKVYVIDNFSRHQDQEIISGDFLCDIIRKTPFAEDTFINILEKLQPFAVFNLAAAVASVEYNQKHHNQMFLDNINLQTIPVMVCEQLGVPYFLQVSSACVYGEDANAPAHEGNLGGEPVGANAGYSWAKRMGERAVQWSKLKYAVIVRPSNIYGPGDWYDHRAHVIPKLIRGYAEKTAKIFGGGKTIREFLYVTDAAEGLLHALAYGEHKGAYNLGSPETVSIKDLHVAIGDAMKVDYIAPDIPEEFDQGDNVRFSDRSKMRRLGWTPKVSMQMGLQKTIEAYLETK